MTRNRRGKLDKGSINEKPFNSDEKLKKKIGALLKKGYLKKKLLMKNPLTQEEF